MTTISITADGDLHADVVGVLASLPESFRLDPDGEVGVISGGPSWPEETAQQILAGRRGVLVLRPEAVEEERLAALQDLARDSSTPVVIAGEWPANSAVGVFRAALEGRASFPTLVECVATAPTGTPLVRVVLDQLMLVESSTGGRVRIDSTTGDARAWVALGDIDIAGEVGPVVLTGARVAESPGSASVRVSRHDERLAVTVPHASISRPATISIGTSEGDLRLPAVYESSLRTALRALHDRVLTGAAENPELLAARQVSSQAGRVLAALAQA